MPSDLKELLERTAALPTRTVDPGVIVRRARQADRRRAAGSLALLAIAVALVLGLGSMLPEGAPTETLFSPNRPTFTPSAQPGIEEDVERARAVEERVRQEQELLDELERELRAIRELRADDRRALAELQERQRQEELDSPESGLGGRESGDVSFTIVEPAACEGAGGAADCMLQGWSPSKGLLTAPVVADDTLFVAVDAGTPHEGSVHATQHPGSVYAFGLPLGDSGLQPTWSAATSAGVLVPPVVRDGRLFVVDAGSDVGGPGGRGSTVDAFDAETGRPLWSTATDVRVGELAPVVTGTGHLVVIGSELDSSDAASRITASRVLDVETGEILDFQLPADGSVTSLAVALDGQVHYSDDVGVHAFDLIDSVEVWQVQGNLVASSGQGVLAVVDDEGRLTVRNAADGYALWSVGGLPGAGHAPILGEETVSVIDEAGTVHTFSLRDGQALSSVPVGDGVLRGPGTGDERLLALPTRDGLYIVDHLAGDVTTFTPAAGGYNQMNGTAQHGGSLVLTGAPGLFVLELGAVVGQ